MDNSLKTVEFKELKPEKPFLFFVPRNENTIKKYEAGFRIDTLFNLNNIVGVEEK